MKEAIIEIQARNEIQAWKGYLTIIVITHKILEIQIVRIRRNQTNLLCFSLKQMKLPRLYQFHVREKLACLVVSDGNPYSVTRLTVAT